MESFNARFELGECKDLEYKATPVHRCNKKLCQRYVSPAFGHPVFMQNDNGNQPPIVEHARILFLLNLECNIKQIHHITGYTEKIICRLSANLDAARRRRYVCVLTGHATFKVADIVPPTNVHIKNLWPKSCHEINESRGGAVTKVINAYQAKSC